MNIIEQISTALRAHLENYFAISAITGLEISLNSDQQKQQFGDISTNAPLVLAKQLKQNPRALADQIIAHFSHPFIAKQEIAGAGFINLFLTRNALNQLTQQIGETGEQFFKLNIDEPRYNYSVEFVSANPTGPLHLGHGRGGIIGDVLGNILTFIGHTVTKEFYINDAGNQIQKLGLSFKIRCEQVMGKNIVLPEDAYHGEYLLELARTCVAQFGKTELENKSITFFEQYAKEQLLHALKATLQKYGIVFDVWFSEKTLHENGAITHALAILEKRDQLYTKDNALWFKSTQYGDDKDRVVKKNTGELTYVAADIAYLENKLDRGFNKLIMVLGQDHHSYVIRLKAVLQALGKNPDSLDVILYQLVTLKESGQIVRMSKRTGKIVDLEEVIDLVGVDVARFFYLNKKADAHLEFDVELALKKTDENPVYYAQYAYVRTKSILEKAYQDAQLRDINPTDSVFLSDSETLLIKKICALKELLKHTQSNYQTHLLTYYVLELAQIFHSYYGKNRVIDLTQISQSRGRLYLVMLIQNTLRTCFKLLGINAPESM
jgi:arginyl-tRNA synthetase